MSSPMVHASFVRVILAGAHRLDLDTAALIRRANLLPEPLEAADGRVPQTAVHGLWEALCQTLDDPAAGLRVAAAGPTRALGVLEYAVRHCRTLGEICERLARFAPLINPAGQIALRREPGGLRVIYRDLDHPVPTRCAVDFVLGYLLHRLRAFTGHALYPLEISFQHREPADAAPYRRFFRGPVRWRQPTSSMLFSHAQLRVPVQAPDTELATLMQQLAEERLARLTVGATPCLAAQVRDQLKALLPQNQGTLDEVARRLGHSGRTVQRRLQAEGTHFKALLAEVRMELAAGLLGEGQLPVAEVAWLTGFSGPSAFHRAFRGAYGLTPGAWREAACASGG
ncbi:MAG: AraC family transcriptional regulator [Myxococcales bacterium]|nr:AraC family transcriptional regulator [Myxococcales bacterium]MCB9524004.1 AraC family transcriptional regulator [Myxococcales bacterium]